LTDANVMCFVATAKPEEALAFYRDTPGLTVAGADEYAFVITVDDTRTLRLPAQWIWSPLRQVSLLSPHNYFAVANPTVRHSG
jgi:catechol 2,3-dioxygenase-like lactoylglutathione lyase family enzyme